MLPIGVPEATSAVIQRG